MKDRTKLSLLRRSPDPRWDGESERGDVGRDGALRRATRLLATVLLAALLLTVTAGPTLAAPLLGSGAEDTTGLTAIIESIITLITGIAKVLAVLGLVTWGVAQFIQPFTPEVNQRFQGYATKVVFGAILVLGAEQIVDWLWGIG
ncbi:MAG: TrbC/VirB2 family protein [Anaerolineae bacterium]|jgi:type IV secretory pathway VirB2 component (pilin)